MNRRDLLKIASASALGVLASGDAVTEIVHAPICQYDLFEVSLKGPSSGNPFINVHLQMTITPIAGSFSEKPTLQLPGRPYQAIRFRSV
jgi:hypothetical protein